MISIFVDLINSIIEISIGCAISVSIVLILSKFIKKNYKIQWRYFIWLALAVRMIIPFNVTLPEKSIPVYIHPRAYINTQNAVHTMPVQSAVTNAVQLLPHSDSAEKAVYIAVEKTSSHLPSHPLLFAIWSFGFVCFLIYQLVNCISYNMYLKRWSVKADEKYQTIFDELCRLSGIKNTHLYICRNLETPVMTGLLRSCIYLPELDMPDEQIRLVLKHELVHKKRCDLWYKLLMLLANAVHWFNPFAYIMRRCADNDIELICDSIVLDGADENMRSDYANAMLYIMKQSLKHKPSLSTHFLGGGKIMKERFSRLFDTTVKKRGILLFCTVAVISVTCACLFGCRSKTQEESEKVTQKSLFDSQIEYVGDASAVGRVRYEIDRLELASGLIAENGLELKTTSEPYGAVFKYTTASPVTEVRYKQLEAISAMYLAMIKNLGYVTIEVKNDSIDTTVVYTPDKITFYDDVKSIATAEELDRLTALATEYAAEDDQERSVSDGDIEKVIQQTLNEKLEFERNIRSSWPSEFGVAAHMTLRVDEDENTAFAYIVTSESEYYFEHINGKRIFTVCSGSGLIPAKMTLSKSDGKYKYEKIEYPMDGGMWLKSLKDMNYPDDLLYDITKKNEKYYKYLCDYKSSAAAEYLKLIKSQGKLTGDIPPVIENPEHSVPENINIEASNKLLDMYGEYPYFIGGLERVENGIRYVYTRGYDEKTKTASYVKTEFDTGNVVEEAIIDVSSGEIKYLKGVPRKSDYSKYPDYE